MGGIIVFIFLAIVILIPIWGWLVYIIKTKELIELLRNRHPEIVLESGVGNSWWFVTEGGNNWFLILRLLMSKRFNSIEDKEIKNKGRIVKLFVLSPVAFVIAGISVSLIAAFYFGIPTK